MTAGAERLARAQLLGLEVGRLSREADGLAAEAAGADAERAGAIAGRMGAIRAEMDVLLASAYELRREQLVEAVEAARPRPRRRWPWRRA